MPSTFYSQPFTKRDGPQKARKLTNLHVEEISFVDKAANPHARVMFFKRADPNDEDDNEPRGRQPADFSIFFAAGGSGPMHDKLWALFDDRRRALGPAQGQRAFADAWNALTDDERQTIRDEEKAAEAERERKAEAAQKERLREMNKSENTMNAIVELAKKINAGESGNHRSKSGWYRVTKILSEQQRRSDETSEQAFSRFITETSDGKELYATYKNASGPDYSQPTATPVQVIKQDSAYANLKKLAAEFREEHPELTEHQAFAKIATDPKNRDLLETSKRENAFG
jgi:hypothetical protein